MLQLATQEHALLGQEGRQRPCSHLSSAGKRLSSPGLHFLQLPREQSPPEDGPLCWELDQSLSLIREDKQCGDWAGPSSLPGRGREELQRLGLFGCL